MINLPKHFLETQADFKDFKIFQETPELAHILGRGVRGGAFPSAGAQEPLHSPAIHPSQEGRIPAQPSTQKRLFSCASSCLFPGKQARCQKFYPDWEGKKGEEAEEGGGWRKKIESLGIKWKMRSRWLQFETISEKLHTFSKHWKPLRALKRHKPAGRCFPPALRSLTQL